MNEKRRMAGALMDIATSLKAGWRVAREAPAGVWLLTYRAGENGVSISMRMTWPNGEEWAAVDGRNTITHGTYARPTFYLAPLEEEVMSIPQPTRDGGDRLKSHGQLDLIDWIRNQTSRPE